MTETIIDIIIKLIAAFVVLYLAPKAKAWMEARIGKTETEKLLEKIRAFVFAADQLFKEEDPTGEIRKDYVMGQLQNLGIAVTGEVNAYIEAAVLEVNK